MPVASCELFYTRAGPTCGLFQTTGSTEHFTSLWVNLCSTFFYTIRSTQGSFYILVDSPCKITMRNTQIILYTRNHPCDVFTPLQDHPVDYLSYFTPYSSWSTHSSQRPISGQSAQFRLMEYLIHYGLTLRINFPSLRISFKTIVYPP